MLGLNTLNILAGVHDIDERDAFVLREGEQKFGMATFTPKTDGQPMPTRTWVAVEIRVDYGATVAHVDVHPSSSILTALVHINLVVVQVIAVAARTKQLSTATFFVVAKLELH